MAVGTPEITPAGLSDNPAGKAPPEVSVQVYGEVPLMAVSDVLYAPCTVPVASEVVETLTVVTTIEIENGAVAPFASVTETVPENVPAAVGAPLKASVAAPGVAVTPGGNPLGVPHV